MDDEAAWKERLFCLIRDNPGIGWVAIMNAHQGKVSDVQLRKLLQELEDSGLVAMTLPEGRAFNVIKG